MARKVGLNPLFDVLKAPRHRFDPTEILDSVQER